MRLEKNKISTDDSKKQNIMSTANNFEKFEIPLKLALNNLLKITKMFTSNTSKCVQIFTCSVNRDTYIFLICDGSEYLKRKEIARLLIEKPSSPGRPAREHPTNLRNVWPSSRVMLSIRNALHGRGTVEAQQRPEVRLFPGVQHLLSTDGVNDICRLRSQSVFFQKS